MSLSNSLRKDANRLYGQRQSGINRSHSKEMSSASESLPLLNTKTFAKSADIVLDSPSRHADSFSRLSGLQDPHNSSGLFGEKTLSMRPSIICVRCGTVHASICIPCSELVCENTLTFYRKTRAAGAAALFNKAFVEAGNSKLVKFFIFRLLRNSYDDRKRQQMKMRSVVERMFGQNVIFFPFNAWKKYTKMSILQRKDRTISGFEDKIRALEMQLTKQKAENERLERESKAIHQEMRQISAVLKEQNAEISQLRERKKKDQVRILGLCNMAFPLQKFSTMVDDVLKHESADLRHYLNYAVNNAEAHNYSDVYPETILSDAIHNQSELYRVMKPRRQQLNIDVSHRLLTDWMMSVSRSATNHIDPLTGASLDAYLPELEPVNELKDFRSGKNLIRVIVALIWEYHKKAMHVISSAPERAHRRISTEAPQLLSSDNLLKIQDMQEQPVQLVKLSLDLATKSFGLPKFRVMDIVAGKTDIIFALLSSILNAVKPLVNHDEYLRVGQFMGQYENLRSEIWELCNEKTTLTHFEDLIEMWAKYHDLDPETGDKLPEDRVEAIVDNCISSMNLCPDEISAAVAADADAGTASAAMDISGKQEHTKLGGVEAVNISVDASNKSSSNNSSSKTELSATKGKTSPNRRMSFIQASEGSSTVSAQTAFALYKPVDYEERYQNLLNAIDLLITNREDKSLTDVARKNHDVNRDFLNLMGKITHWRDERARGMRFSTEMRSFITQTYMEKALQFMEYVEEEAKT